MRSGDGEYAARLHNRGDGPDRPGDCRAPRRFRMDRDDRATGPAAASSGAFRTRRQVVTLDRDEPGALARALASGADVLIDTVAYDRNHARQLLEVQGVLGSLVVVSSSSVYRDHLGRTLDEAADTGFPELPEPISEAQPTVEPGPATYSTRKAALERVLHRRGRRPADDPAACGGQRNRLRASERMVVRQTHARRPSDHTVGLRRQEPLPYLVGRQHRGSRARRRGQPGQTHSQHRRSPRLCQSRRSPRRLHPPRGFSGRFVMLPDDPYPPAIGATPWSVQHPFVLDMTAATALGYRAADLLRSDRRPNLRLAPPSDRGQGLARSVPRACFQPV